jgi:hypothetical protein
MSKNKSRDKEGYVKAFEISEQIRKLSQQLVSIAEEYGIIVLGPFSSYPAEYYIPKNVSQHQLDQLGDLWFNHNDRLKLNGHRGYWISSNGRCD